MDYTIETSKSLLTQSVNGEYSNTVYRVIGVTGTPSKGLRLSLKGWLSKEAYNSNRTPLQSVPMITISWQKAIKLLLKAIKQHHIDISEDIKEEGIYTEEWPSEQLTCPERVFLYSEDFMKLNLNTLPAMAGYINANVPYVIAEHGVYLYPNEAFAGSDRTALGNNNAYFQTKTEYDNL